MNDAQLRANAKKFSEKWTKDIDSGVVSKDFHTHKVGENSHTQKFWLELLQTVFEIENAMSLIEFQISLPSDDTTLFVDAIIPSTRVLIEQKGPDVNLDAKIKHGKDSLTPYEQAKRYDDNARFSEKSHWIITCNFKEFRIYDMDKVPSKNEPIKYETILLENLEKEIDKLEFLTDAQIEPNFPEESVVKNALQAGEHVRDIYDALLKQYTKTEINLAKESLNALCVRLVFCLYAEDAGIFRKNQFYNYIKNNEGKDYGRMALINLFKILDTPIDKRKYEADDLLKFPYVDGSLFAEDNLEIPKFNDEIFLILKRISWKFNWAKVSPTIFGSVFESTLNDETRNTEGMHYTSETNIHKVIDPLFLNDLKKEFEEIKQINVPANKKIALENFQNKLASIKILDPACGSGNFLTESYLSLRKLENEILAEMKNDLHMKLDENCIKVNIQQFYGIEIHDFAVKVAQTAMLIAENQMMQETQLITKKNFKFLPLEKHEEIIEANALKMDWADLVKPSELSYIIGNPPFAGAKSMSREQKTDTLKVFKGWKQIGKFDYVCNWFKVASDYIDGTQIRCALLATNSICQGEQVSILWKPLFEKIHFDFAYRTFKWSNEAENMAQVYCIILGFSQAENSKPKLIFDEGKEKTPTIAKNINAYLVNSNDIFVEVRKYPISNVSVMIKGSVPTDGGNLLLSSKEKNELLEKYPAVEKFIRPYMGADEFIHRKERFCLWLVDAEPYELKNCPEIKRRLEQVKETRLKSSDPEMPQKRAHTPHLFTRIRQPNTDYLAVPGISTGSRQYIPIGYLDKNIIASNRLYTVPNASLYEFGVITSNVHMAWMRSVAGHLGTGYSYTNTIVYNTFVWCEPTEKQKEKIKQTAQKILDVREKYSSSSYADLYDETSMPPDLRKAHEENDKAVMQAYGFDLNFSEADIVRELLNLYQQHKTK